MSKPIPGFTPPPWSHFICVDNGLDAHDWYRAPSLDTDGDGWMLAVAKALPAGIMYVGRVDTNGRHQWLSPLGDPVSWVWWDYVAEQMPVLRRPRKPSSVSVSVPS